MEVQHQRTEHYKPFVSGKLITGFHKVVFKWSYLIFIYMGCVKLVTSTVSHKLLGWDRGERGRQQSRWSCPPKLIFAVTSISSPSAFHLDLHSNNLCQSRSHSFWQTTPSFMWIIETFASSACLPWQTRRLRDISIRQLLRQGGATLGPIRTRLQQSLLHRLGCL